MVSTCEYIDDVHILMDTSAGDTTTWKQCPDVNRWHLPFTPIAGWCFVAMTKVQFHLEIHTPLAKLAAPYRAHLTSW